MKLTGFVLLDLQRKLARGQQIFIWKTHLMSVIVTKQVMVFYE